MAGRFSALQRESYARRPREGRDVFRVLRPGHGLWGDTVQEEASRGGRRDSKESELYFILECS